MRGKITAQGSLLTANVDERVLTYRLLPYGEPGRTSRGTVTASRGVITLPDDPSALVANMEHDPTRPVARAVSLEETDEGITAAFRVAATTAGNDLLIEAAEGLRTGISVEVMDPVIKAGAFESGALVGAGFTSTPAFPSAQLVAADTDPEPDEGDTVSLPVETDEQGRRVVEIGGVKLFLPVEDDPDAEDDTPEEEADASESTDDPANQDGATDAGEGNGPDAEGGSNVNASTRAATADASLRASAGGGGRKDILSASAHPVDLFRVLAEVGRTKDSQLTAALVDITQTGAIGNTEVPQYVGELWDGRAAERRIIPLFNHADLTSFKVNGWRWLVKPAVGPYTGDKADIPSNAVSTEPVTLSAERLAGGHDIDRKYVDFGDEGFWQSYLAAMTESYAVQSDSAVMADVIAAATPVVLGAGSAVTGVSEVWIKIVDGVLAVLQATNTMPNAAVLAFDLYRDFLLTPQDKGLEYLNAALGFENGSVGNFAVLPHASLAAGNALVTAREAVTVHELSTTPIRVEAENIGKGGIDVGVFGYYATNIHDEDGLALVSGTPS